MNNDCPLCEESYFECKCYKAEKHAILIERRREIIRKKLAQMFNNGNADRSDSETAVVDQDPPA